MRKPKARALNPGETAVFQPEQIDPVSLLIPLLNQRMAARKKVKLKIGNVTFDCFLYSLEYSAGRVRIGVAPTGAPKIGDKKP